MRIFLWICLSVPGALAQPLPMVGLLVDHVNRTIRTITAGEDGALAGQARLSEFDAAWATPDGRTALLAKSNTLYLVRRLDGGIPVWREVRGDGPSVARAAWSADSSAVALYLPGEQRVEFWKEKQGELRRAFSVELAGVNERVVSLAVAPQAKAAFLATQGRESGTLWILQEGREPRMLMPLSRAGEVQFAEGAVYLADRGRNEVLRYTGWDASPRLDLLLTAGHGLADPVGFALLPEEKKLVVASAGTSQLLVLDLRSNLLGPPVPLEEPPARLERLGAAPLFLLDSTATPAPARVFDASTQRLLAMAAEGDPSETF
ncbi:MAG: hypothetical protein ACUVS7_02595 [Bryobacteraceae bacterium]